MTTFGRETSCTNSMRTGRTVTGVRVVAEAVYRRLTTPRGMLRGGEEEASYGLDLTEFVGTMPSKSVEASLPGRIAAELAKDERIEKTDVDVLVTKSGPETTYGITVRCETAEGPFTLQLSASDVTVELIGIAA